MTASMQWTIDPRQITGDTSGSRVSSDVCSKAIEVYEARVIARLSRRLLRVPSWSTKGRWYNVAVAAAPNGWKVTCQCDSTGWCHHGYAAALELARLDGLEIPTPRPDPPRKTKRSRPLTVIPGGRA